MRQARLPLALLAVLAASALPTGVAARPALLQSVPAAEASVTSQTQLRLRFSEPLAGPLSGIELVMTAMPGMADHPPMPVKGFTTQAKGSDLVAMLPRPLPRGTYRLTWHAVGADRQQVEGSYTFTVR